MDEYDTQGFDNEGFDTEGFDTESFESPQGVFDRREVIGLGIPLVTLLVVVAIVSGLVFAGVVQGHESRVGTEQAPTTRDTVLIVP